MSFNFSDTHVENFETSNIQYTNEVLSLLFGVKSFVTLLDEPFEETIEHTLGHGTNGVGYLVDVTTLGYELVTDLDSWFQETSVHVLCVNTQQLGDSVTLLWTEKFVRFLRVSFVLQDVLLCHRLQPVLHDPFA